MAGRGQQQRGRTGQFAPDKTIRAVVTLPPGDPLRSHFEDLVRSMGVSGAEVVRRALLALTSDGRTAGHSQEEAAA